MSLQVLTGGIPIDPLPRQKPRDLTLPHAPNRPNPLSPAEERRALCNALRYFPPELHAILVNEFAEELMVHGHIYMYRFRPDFEMKAYPIGDYPARCKHAAAIMLMIMNNLDPNVAQYPHELVTYGGNGQVFSNWAQFWLVMRYLSSMSEEQTLVMYSGHPLGLFPSSKWGPRMVITNGMVIPNYSSRLDYDRMFALGVTMYGQMTAGSYCYIGPQGIVHGTTLTIINAGRKYLGTDNLAGKAFLTSGLGGMSGAQAKAATISGCVGVIAEVCLDAIYKRFNQGWLKEIITDLDQLIRRLREAKKNKEATSIAYHGNVVEVWERIAAEMESTGELLFELGSDQTSCHNPFNGGYYPVQLSIEEADVMMKEDHEGFKEYVQESLIRQSDAINKLADNGLHFWDYGNAFLLEAQRAGASISSSGSCMGNTFRYPSYVQDIMGDIFSLGFGPFRWICLSCDPEDLAITDQIAKEVMKKIMDRGVSEKTKQQYNDNLHWITEAGCHNLVVGSQARILYSDQKGRVEMALAFNQAVREKKLKGPVVISRDHHDVSGTDSPFRETSDVKDGSAFTADMAVQNCIGDAFRGATWVALHNGGGVGWGEVINGGFGLVLDGSEEASLKAKSMLAWDVTNGIARRSWSGNDISNEAIREAMAEEPRLEVTLPHPISNDTVLQGALVSLTRKISVRYNPTPTDDD